MDERGGLRGVLLAFSASRWRVGFQQKYLVC
nr:MAG TPA: hypothetical protein [Caudoviricetes sp.]